MESGEWRVESGVAVEIETHSLSDDIQIKDLMIYTVWQ